MLGQNDLVYLIYLFKVAVPGKKGAAYTHTARGYPHIVYWNTSTFVC